MEIFSENFTKDNKVAVRDEEIEEMILNLRKVKHPIIHDGYNYYYQGIWIPDRLFKGVIFFRKYYVARDDDIVLISCPKSGTTWLKALTFTIVNRTRFTLSNSPLFVTNPHDLVPEVEASLNNFQSLCSENMKPRLFSTHIGYPLLPPSIKNSKCKIVYICRNPLDLFVSLWHFSPKFLGEDIEPHRLEECFDMFCEGIHAFGPFWDHVLGFWKASLETPHNILFLKYEDLKKDNVFFIKKIANFLGFPFSMDEEQKGVIEEISKFCSIDKMKSMEINKVGKHDPLGISNSAFFRKGKVGDWRNYLTPQMVKRGKELIEEKFRESNITFDFELPDMEE